MLDFGVWKPTNGHEQESTDTENKTLFEFHGHGRHWKQLRNLLDIDPWNHGQAHYPLIIKTCVMNVYSKFMTILKE